MPSSQPPQFDSVEAAVADIAAGRMVIVTDDERRENEGDLIIAASKATVEAIGIMIRHGSGIVCVATTGEVLSRLGLSPMVANNMDAHRTDFAVSVDAAQGVTTGISAADRTRTIRIIGDPASKPGELARPGHVFPLRARPGGVLERPGHTEAAVDLAILAGLHPSGVLCELMNDDGTVARMPNIVEFKKRFGLRMISIADLLRHRAKSCCGLPAPGSALDSP
jgi:3,4-dihydroxy 2-butanone 4-phosphate synthase / GTP cyclohydrolase II